MGNEQGTLDNQGREGIFVCLSTGFFSELWNCCSNGSELLNSLVCSLAGGNFGDALDVLKKIFDCCFLLLQDNPMLLLKIYGIVCLIIGLYKATPRIVKIVKRCFDDVYYYANQKDNWGVKAINIAGVIFKSFGEASFELIKEFIFALASPVFLLFNILSLFASILERVGTSIGERFGEFLETYLTSAAHQD